MTTGINHADGSGNKSKRKLLRKQAEEAQARAYLAALKADAAAQRANVAQQNSKANNAALGGLQFSPIDILTVINDNERHVTEHGEWPIYFQA
ncbi:hypothetical protein Tco_1564147 [Tanacetum coccineum]